MINFFSETSFNLTSEDAYRAWLLQIATSENKALTELNYIFCDDAYLNEINIKYLNHHDLTDIISFQHSEGKQVGGDIYISIERVTENAEVFKVSLAQELLRVMAHGLLHFCGYKDKTADEAKLMREKEDEKIKMFHVEQ